MKLVVATKNAGKLAELRALVKGLRIDVVAIETLRAGWHVEEVGETFAENATAKARAAASATGEWALGDDSGLEVDALLGAPGVRSARYAGERAGDAANNAKLLEAMKDAPHRRARFRCALALVSPSGEMLLAEDVCQGTVGTEPRGDGGFGYDPLFVPDEGKGLTMAELPADEKNRISHRGRALAKLRGLLAEIASR
jgi:XTP/dITP diphosphohydrolase